MTAPLALADRLGGPDPQVGNRVLWDSRCADCGTMLVPGIVQVAVESLCAGCVKLRALRWRADG